MLFLIKDYTLFRFLYYSLMSFFVFFFIPGSHVIYHNTFSSVNRFPWASGGCDSFSDFFFFFNDIDSFEEYCCGILQNTSHLEFVWCFFSWLDCSNVSLGRKTIEIKYNSYHSILSHMINIIFTFDVDFDHLVVIVLFARFLHGWVIQSSFYIVLFA